MKYYVWGTGLVADEVVSQGINGIFKGFVETRKRKEKYKGYPVYNIYELNGDEFDYIIVANNFPDEIYFTCIERNISLEKIIFMVRGKNTRFIDSPYIRELLGENNYSRYAVEYGRLKGTFLRKMQKNIQN